MVTSTPAAVEERAAAEFARRDEPGRWLLTQTQQVAGACRDMAERFRAGGRLLVFGGGASVTDARHVAVEFVHPVLVGKRPLPAIALPDDVATVTAVAQTAGFDGAFAHQIGTLARPGDIALGLTTTPDDRAVAGGLAAAEERGLLTVALACGGEGPAAHHTFAVPTDDPLVAKEVQVTLYHLLWELVHVWLDVPAPTGDAPAGDTRDGGDAEDAEDAGDLGGLYPFLYEQRSRDASGSVAADVARSSAEKAEEIVSLRRRVGADEGAQVARCAQLLAGAFDAGGTLFAFGNGGSSTDADALVAALQVPGAGARPLPAVSLDADVAVVSALANDVGIDVAFSRPLASIAVPGDVAVGLSTSGNSGNVVAALVEARRRGLHTVGFAGNDGGAMAELELDTLFVVPSASVHRIQEAQTTLYHVLARCILGLPVALTP